MQVEHVDRQRETLTVCIDVCKIDRKIEKLFVLKDETYAVYYE